MSTITTGNPGTTGYFGFEALDDDFDNATDIVCLSHLRWDFVYQRPQHLMSRCARERRVFFFEEPIFLADAGESLDVRKRDDGVCTVTPMLPQGLSESEIRQAQRRLLDDFFRKCSIRDYVLWYYTPAALSFTRHLDPPGVVYDCMDELTGFKGASPDLRDLEEEMFKRADVVFTGGRSLFEAKRNNHSNIHACPSSIDVDHFAMGRRQTADPSDQAPIAHPRLGFFGVIDERMDCDLLAGVADARPDWQFVIIGPVVKIDESLLPRRPNIHYLGAKKYAELPSYIAGWDAALMPFAHNESTKFISPTKTPEYLAAGKPVISTSILDVVSPYGEMGLVHIADDVPGFVAAAEVALKKDNSSDWLRRVDAFLSQDSWDTTWLRMMKLMDSAVVARTAADPMTNESGSVSSPDPYNRLTATSGRI